MHDTMRITVTETTDSNLFIVHGSPWPAPTGVDDSASNHYVTLIPGPAVCHRETLMQVVHFCFKSCPSRLRPHDDSVLSVFESPREAGIVVLSLWMRTRQAFIHARIGGNRSNELEKHGWLGLMATEGESMVNELTAAYETPFDLDTIRNLLNWRACWSEEYVMEGPGRWMALEEAKELYGVRFEVVPSTTRIVPSEENWTPQPERGSAAVCIRLPVRVADAERAVHSFFSSCPLVASSAFCDYATLPLLDPGTGISWSPFLQEWGHLLLVLIMLDSRGGPSAEGKEILGCKDVALVVHCPLETGLAHVIAALPLTHPWKKSWDSGLMECAAQNVGQALEKAAGGGAVTKPWAVPMKLRNDTVLENGESLTELCHPWLPIALLGFG